MQGIMTKAKKQNVLFVCTAGRHRSRTAAHMFKDNPHYEAKAAGVHPLATPRVSQAHIDWADKVFVFNEKTEGQESFIKNHFKLGNTSLHNLQIPDAYLYGHPELKQILKSKLEDYFLPKTDE